MTGWEPLLLAAIGGMLVGFLLTLFGGGGSVLATPWLFLAAEETRKACVRWRQRRDHP